MFAWFRLVRFGVLSRESVVYWLQRADWRKGDTV